MPAEYGGGAIGLREAAGEGSCEVHPGEILRRDPASDHRQDAADSKSAAPADYA